MNYTKDKLNKRISFAVLFFMIFAAFSFSIISITNSYRVEAQEKQRLEVAYKTQVDSLAKKVNLSFDVQALSQSEEVKVVYNFLALYKFSDETDLSTASYKATGKTNYQVVEEMFNTGEYSVNKYYKTISYGKLDLRTVIVTQPGSSASSTQARNYFVDKYKRDNNGNYILDENGNKIVENSNGYDAEVPYKFFGQIIDPSVTEEIFRGIQFLNPAFGSVKNYIQANNLVDDADHDNDGKIDSISVLYFASNEQNNLVKWNDLLWPHSWTIPKALIDEVSSNSYAAFLPLMGITPSNFKMSIAGKTLYAGAHMVNKFSYEENASTKTELPKNNTDIHELGHVIGWPDYYLYGNLTSTTGEPVDVWDIMANNHMMSPQYPTTYSRQKQGWLWESSVQNITRNGIYSLLPVNYEEVNGLKYGGRTLAYKINHPTDPTQSIYIEYRKQDSNSFEDNKITDGIQDGLIIYRVDEGFGDGNENFSHYTNVGNMAAVPYNLYVFRNTISGVDQKKYAPLNENNPVMGTNDVEFYGGRQVQSQPITWQSYIKGKTQEQYAPHEVSEVASGIEIRFNGIAGTGEIMFEVFWDEFEDEQLPEEEIVTQAEFNNDNLYNILVQNFGSNGTLLKNALINQSVINLSNQNLQSIQGLHLLEFQENAILNLSFNNLSLKQEIDELLENKNIIINLMFNNFNYFANSNNNIIYGIQKLSANYLLKITTGQMQTFAQEQEITFVNFNDFALYYTLNLAIQPGQNTITQTGTYNFNFTPTQQGFAPINQTIVVAGVTVTPENQIEFGQNFTLDDILTFENASKEDFEFEILDESGQLITLEVLTSTLGQKEFSIRIFQNGVLIETVSSILIVIDTQVPVITLNGPSVIYMFGDDVYVEQGAIISDNYNQDLTPEISGAFDSSVAGTYVLTYNATDSSGNRAQAKQRTIIVLKVTPIYNTLHEVLTQPNLASLFIFENCVLTDFDIEYVQNINPSELGAQTIKVKFKHKTITGLEKQFETVVLMVDNVIPTISTTGSTVEYIYIDSAYTPSPIVATDNFTPSNQIQIVSSGEVNEKRIGTYNLTYYALDEANNRSADLVVTVHVIYKPLENLKIQRVSRDNIVTKNTTLTFGVNLTEFSAAHYNHNSIFVWFVDGVEVQRGNLTTFSYTFLETKKYNLEVKAINTNLSGRNELATNAQSFEVDVTDGGFVEKYMLPIVGGGSAFVILTVIFSSVIKKKRRLF
ncbi:MAG: immunoglobulin-like domain-containing protein [Christensenellales bacterium]|jgi:M6 family metalloprotease-like protein